MARTVVSVLLGLVVFAGIVIGGWFGVKAYQSNQDDKRYQEVLAGMEARDPHWKWPDLLAQRAVVPDDQNSALVVVAAAKHFPGGIDWTPRRPNLPLTPAPAEGTEAAEAAKLIASWGQPYPQAVHRLIPTGRLPEMITKEMRDAVNSVRPALLEARKLAVMPRGRYAVDWHEDPLFTPRPDLKSMNSVTGLLFLDALLLAEEGSLDDALRSCCAAFNAARSMGDEPLVSSMAARAALGPAAIRATERVLGQGSAQPESLAALQKLMEDELAQPLAKIALRGERALVADGLGQLCAGKPWRVDVFGDFEKNIPERVNQSVYLEMMTRLIQAQDQPPISQSDAIRGVHRELNESNRTRLALAHRCLGIALQAIETMERHMADVQTCRVALATERYRLAHGRWPETVQDLVPEFLDSMPRGYYGVGSLQIKRTKEGVVVQTVDPNRTPDMPRVIIINRAGVAPFTLHDPQFRRQPPALRPLMDEALNQNSTGSVKLE